MKRHSFAIVTALAFVLLGAAEPPALPSASPAPVATVHIKDFVYRPATVKIHPGDIVAFVNDDEAAHTVTANDKSFDSGNLERNARWIHAFSAAGTFAYICTYHPMMKGSVEVVSENARPTAASVQAHLPKALASDDVAERNHYPGPRDVLDNARRLELSAKQIVQSQAIFDAMSAQALPLEASIADRERALDSAFASGHIDAATMQALTAEIAALEGRLRAVHLGAHIAERALLSAQQIARYDAIRAH